ncbi:hypothetical protein RM863_21760 [Streptomyces sp. DSM 41014]|uniref:Secreted protein n=1 Tax=Streptomyces hintoniae TaxID=3075521 RepID=A0ABU2UN93_9ACTN|nr:hypothetical protein [Streptomyces sp. DSM 41014]MDT0474753.1 hypothetical protein [Streptomyces sp. DSM 41014]
MRPTRPTFRRPAAARTALALTALSLLLAGCGPGTATGSGSVGGSPSAASPSRGCAPPAELGAGDSGRTVCVAVGGVVRVDLDGSEARPWKPLAVSGAGLRATNSGLVLGRGDATGAYRAVAAGTARLASARPLCPTGAGEVSCVGLQGWSLTVVVR